MAKKQKYTKEDSALQRRLGVAVKSHRQQLGITQEELAWRADMHRTYVADIERGARNISLRSIANLAKALELSVEGLLFHSSGAGGLVDADAGGAGAGEILLVEDNPDDVELTLRAFKHARITNLIRVAGDGEEALDYLLRRGRFAKQTGRLPNLLLLDLGLPGISGLELLRQIKAHKLLREVPVVILTVSRQDQNILECSRLGAASYIVKPVEFEAFARVTAKMNFNWSLRPSPRPLRMALSD